MALEISQIVHRKHPLKKVLFVIWAVLICAAIYFYVDSGLSLREITTKLRVSIMDHGLWGPALYVMVYSFRSLFFFPASLLTAISGVLFGPWLGIILTVIGENISANLSFLVGRYFGSGFVERFFLGTKRLSSFGCKFRENGLMGVMILRLMYLPFDLVGYMSGACNIRQRDFALGTFIGTIPGLATFVFIGSIITDPKNLILAFASFMMGWAISKYLKARKRLNGALPA